MVCSVVYGCDPVSKLGCARKASNYNCTISVSCFPKNRGLRAVFRLDQMERHQQHQSKSSSISSTSREEGVSRLEPSFYLSPSLSPSLDDNSTITYLFPDFNALKAICSKSQNYETVEISGFEIYIVEQWACERKYSTVITSYTGDSDHEIKAGRLTLPTNLTKWSEKVLHFFKEIEDSGAKPKLTEHGYLFITNLSQFPSNLNLLPVPNGCVLDVWDCFVVNLNLRKLKCGGRSAILLCSPADAAEDKFRQIYKTHPKVGIVYAVKELVTLIQICLVDFKLLDPQFVDGLFCQKTEEKIMDWWNIYGTMYYGVTPKDGILGPTTVAALLGFVLSCHFRLDMAGSDFPKEPFNYFNFRVNVGKFQKQYNLHRTWYLDPSTVEKLFRVTSKVSNSDISKLKKAVKSTVHDIAGKASSEQSAADVLTTDLDKAIKYFNCSARLEYLWLGKGDVRDLKGFDYELERTDSSTSTSGAIVSTSTIRSGVSKIRHLPRMLQSEEHMSSKRKVRKVSNGSDGLCEADNLCLADEEGALFSCPAVDKNQCCDVEVTFGKELQRRSSFPYLGAEVAICQLDYFNHSVPLQPIVEENNTLRKVRSSSFIDEAVEKWDREVSEIRLAKMLKYTTVGAKHLEEVSSRKNNKIEEYRSTIQNCKQRVFEVRHQMTPIFNNCEYERNQQERVNAKISDIQATGARLEYEIRLLSTKIRDTETSVNDFVGKVEKLELAINEKFLDLKSNDDLVDKWYSKIINNERLRSYWLKLQEFSFVKSLVEHYTQDSTSQDLVGSKLNTLKDELLSCDTTSMKNTSNEKLKHT